MRLASDRCSSPKLKIIHQPDLHRPFPATNGVRRFLRFGGMWKWTRTPDLHRVRNGLQPLASSALACARFEDGETNGIRTRATAFTEPDADSYIMASI